VENLMNRTDQLAWLFFLVALGLATVILLVVSSVAFLE
jgi:hypothetical protein